MLTYHGVMLQVAEAVLTYQDKKMELTRNELRILKTLMENKEKVVSRDTLMTKLWESDCFVDENTLSVNVNRLRKKLSDAGLEDFILTKKGIGYRLK
jgi:DNA-binding response OmpR family regulator